MFENVFLILFLLLRFRNSDSKWNFILFGSPNSFVSNSIFRDFSRAADHYSEDASIKFQFIDCQRYSSLCAKAGIRIPTLILYKRKSQTFIYEGPMLMESFIKYINYITGFNSNEDARLHIRNKSDFNVDALLEDGFCVVDVHYQITPQKYLRDAISLLANYSEKIVFFGVPSYIDEKDDSDGYVVVQKYENSTEYRSLIPKKLADEVSDRCLSKR